jgi:anti-sigma factor RsiW
MPQSFLTCRQFVELLSAWNDGELTGSARGSFEEHRAGCGQCAQYAAAFRATVALVKSSLAGSTANTELREEMVHAILAAYRGTK